MPMTRDLFKEDNSVYKSLCPEFLSTDLFSKATHLHSTYLEATFLSSSFFVPSLQQHVPWHLFTKTQDCCTIYEEGIYRHFSGTHHHSIWATNWVYKNMVGEEQNGKGLRDGWTHKEKSKVQTEGRIKSKNWILEKLSPCISFVSWRWLAWEVITAHTYGGRQTWLTHL